MNKVERISTLRWRYDRVINYLTYNTDKKRMKRAHELASMFEKTLEKLRADDGPYKLGGPCGGLKEKPCVKCLFVIKDNLGISLKGVCDYRANERFHGGVFKGYTPKDIDEHNAILRSRRNDSSDRPQYLYDKMYQYKKHKKELDKLNKLC